MAFKSLLLSKDADLVQTLTRLLKDLDITVEPCSEPFAAAKRLMDQQFDAILVDCEDEQGAGWVLQSARMATASKKSVTIAIVGASASQGGPRAGENFVIQKPIVLKQAESTLRAARGLMGGGGAGLNDQAPAPAGNVSAEKPVTPIPAGHAVSSTQGRPPAELFDELTAALDRLGLQGAPAKPMTVASAASGSAAAAAPALEKPAAAPAVSAGAAAEAPPAWQKPAPSAPPPRPEPLAQPVLRPAQQAWPGIPESPSAPPKPELPAVLPLAATAAELKPVVSPAEEQVRSNDALDNVRRRMNASAPPAWRTEVEERHEAPAPRFSSFAMEEQPNKRFPFKAVAVAMVLVSFALFGYSWYRGRNKAGISADQAQPPAATSEQPPATSEPGSVAPAPAAAPSQADNSSIQSAENVTRDNAPGFSTPAAMPSKPAPHARETAEITAPDTTAEVGLPPAPLVVAGGQRHSGSPEEKAEAEVAPPSLDALAGAAKPGLNGVVSTAAVAVPKLAAEAPQRIRVSQGVTQGLLVRQVKPQYPSMARETRVEGDVVLEAVIGKDGTVRDLKAISGPAMLVGPAIRAVRQWRYKPYLLNGQPVEVETQVKLQFRL